MAERSEGLSQLLYPDAPSRMFLVCLFFVQYWVVYEPSRAKRSRAKPSSNVGQARDLRPSPTLFGRPTRPGGSLSHASWQSEPGFGRPPSWPASLHPGHLRGTSCVRSTATWHLKHLDQDRSHAAAGAIFKAEVAKLQQSTDPISFSLQAWWSWTVFEKAYKDTLFDCASKRCEFLKRRRVVSLSDLRRCQAGQISYEHWCLL